MRNITVLTARDGHAWLMYLPELDCVSAARSRAEVRSSARELAAVWLDVPTNTINIGRVRYLGIHAVQLVDHFHCGVRSHP